MNWLLRQPCRRNFEIKDFNYSLFLQVKTVFVQNLSTLESAHSSIPNLTEAFLQGLMSNFPSTEMTVYRLSNKVRSSEHKLCEKKNNKEKSKFWSQKCRLCLGFVADRKTSGASAERDLMFTEKLLTEGLPRECEDADSFNQVPSAVEASRSLCYSCSVLTAEVEDSEFLDKLPSKSSQCYTNEQFLNDLKGVIIEDEY